MEAAEAVAVSASLVVEAGNVASQVVDRVSRHLGERDLLLVDYVYRRFWHGREQAIEHSTACFDAAFKTACC